MTNTIKSEFQLRSQRALGNLGRKLTRNLGAVDDGRATLATVVSARDGGARLCLASSMLCATRRERACRVTASRSQKAFTRGEKMAITPSRSSRCWIGTIRTERTPKRRQVAASIRESLSTSSETCTLPLRRQASEIPEPLFKQAATSGAVAP